MAPHRPVILPKFPSAQLEVWCDAGPFPAPGQIACAALVVGGRYTQAAVQAYAGTDTRIVTLVDWPSGLDKPTLRQIAAVAAAKDGTHAITFTANPPQVTNGRWDALRDDLLGVVVAAREVNREVIINVAVDLELISDDKTTVENLCLALRESGVDGLVTSTAFPSPFGLKQRERGVRLVKKHAAGLQVTALIGVLDECEPTQWLKLGADRVGATINAIPI